MEGLNATKWRTKFNPNLGFNIATKPQLGNRYSQFGNGYVPMNVIIGGGNRVVYSDNDMPSDDIISQAIMSLDIYLNNPIPLTNLLFGQSASVDLAGSYTTTTGLPIVYSLEDGGDVSLVTAAINGNMLTLTANNQNAGQTKVKIRATSGAVYGLHEFTVKIKDPSVIELTNADFETFPPAGWSNLGWSKGGGGFSGGCARAEYQPAGTRTLTSPAIILPGTETATLTYYWKNNDIAKIVGKDSTFCEITSDNGANWTKLAVLSAASPQSSFSKVTKSLESYKNQTIKMRWRYKTNGSSSAYGVGLDEILISYQGVGILDQQAPSDFNLQQNYPNPFNPVTKISFNLTSQAVVKLTVYNQTGEEVAVLVDGVMNHGLNQIDFDASHLNSGVYFYTLQSGNHSQTGKMLLVK